MGEWTLFSNHGHVLVCLANNNEARLRDVAAEVGITERAVQNILRELQQSGIVQVNKHGRCNRYLINTRKSLRHPLEAHCSVGKLLSLLKSAGAEVDTAEPVVRSKPVEKTARPAKAKDKTLVMTEPAQPAEPAEPAERNSSQGQPLDTPSGKLPVEAVSEAPEPEKPEVRIADDESAMEVKAASKKPVVEIPRSKKSSENNGPPSTPQGSLF